MLQRAVNEVVTYGKKTDWITNKYLVVALNFRFNGGRLHFD